MANPTDVNSGTDEQGKRPLFACTVLMRSGMPDLSGVQERLSALLGRKVKLGSIFSDMANGPGAELPQQLATKSGPAFDLVSDEGTYTCIGMEAPAPGLDEIIQYTRNDKEALAPLREHRAHILCLARSTVSDPVAGYETLFGLAVALRDQGTLGIIQTPAEQCLRIEDLGYWFEQGVFAAVRDGMDKALLCNLIPFFGENGTWWTTKGNYVFSIPDFALWITDELQPDQVRNLLYYMFDYIRKGAKVLPGETIAIGKAAKLGVGQVTEHHEFLQGGGETLTLRFI